MVQGGSEILHPNRLVAGVQRLLQACDHRCRQDPGLQRRPQGRDRVRPSPLHDSQEDGTDEVFE